MNNHKRILILSPHTDDAELGCGGSIYKFLKDGCEVFWVVFSSCEDSLPDNLPPDTLVNEFTNVVNHLNLKDYIIGDFKVRHLTENRQAVLDSLINLRNEFKPSLVIGPSLHDLHQDHITVANEMVRAFKGSASILSYELPWNNITFETQFFVKLSTAHIKKKTLLLGFYKSQIEMGRPYFNEEFIKGLAAVRGAQVNYQYAESFELIRWII